MADTITLGQAEERLVALTEAGDETGWQAMAAQLGQVEDLKLWQQGGYHSFSAWLKRFSERVGKTESLFWRYIKAGRVYKLAKEENTGLPDMAKTSASAAALDNIEKICGTDTRAMADLVGRVENGQLTARDLREMWKSARKVQGGARSSRHDQKPGQAAIGGDAEMTRRLTAALAAQAESWIWGVESKSEAEERKKAQANRRFLTRDALTIKTFAEFPLRVETAERARQIDLAAVTVENQTTADWLEVELRGVEVKVSRSDFNRDQKMADYSLFMDFMYLAVPVGLVGEVQDEVPVEWGILGYDLAADHVAVVREPERLDAPRREAALMTAIVKMARRESK